MNWFLVYIVTPLLSLLLVLLQIPALVEYLEDIWSLDMGLIYLFIGIGTLLNYYFYILSPYLTFQALKKRRMESFNRRVDNLLDTYRQTGQISINIMKPVTRLSTCIEPNINNPGKRKRRLFTKEFKIIWQRGHREIDKSFRITSNQGLCGKVFREGTGVPEIVLFPNPDVKKNAYNFNLEQIKQTKDLMVLGSCDITYKKLDSNQWEQKTTFGVLTVESSSAAFKKLMRSDAKISADGKKTFKDMFSDQILVLVTFYKDLF